MPGSLSQAAVDAFRTVQPGVEASSGFKLRLSREHMRSTTCHKYVPEACLSRPVRLSPDRICLTNLLSPVLSRWSFFGFESL